MDIKCRGCDHKDICKFTDDFAKIVKALSDTYITAGENKTMVKVQSITFIKPIEVDCKHFQNTNQVTIR